MTWSVVATYRSGMGGVHGEKLEDSSSIGVIGMRERLRPYGGVLLYDSVPGKGTRARVIMPVE